MLSTERLRTLVAVARERGFSPAARRLGQTQSSVSQSMAALERQAGERLFVRRSRETLLTEAGRVLLGHAERVLAELEQARVDLEALRELEAGTLVIGTSDTLGCYLLPPVLAAFRTRHPKVELRLDNRPSPAVARRIVERAIDIGVVSLPLPPDLRFEGRAVVKDIMVELLAPQRDVLICAPTHPLAGCRGVALSAIAREPLLLLDRATGTRSYLDTAFARISATPRVTMETSSVELLKRLVALGFGLSVVPAMAVEREVTAREVVALSISDLPAGRSVGLVAPERGPSSRAAQQFAVLCRELLVGQRSEKPKAQHDEHRR